MMIYRSVRSLFLLTGSLCLLFSCSSESSETSLVQTNTDVFRSFPIDVNGEKARMSELVESVELMRLEETEEALLSYLGRFYETEDSYVFNSGREGNLYFYGKDGRFQSKFSRKGDGPEEYQYATSIWVDGDQLCVYSTGKNVVKCYDFKGNFKKSVSLGNPGSQLVPYQGGYVMDGGGRLMQDSLKYKVVFYNSDYEIDTLLMPFEQFSPLIISTTANGFKPYKEGLSLLQVLSDTVYHMEGKSIKPLLHFDFGSQWLWKDQELRYDYQAGLEALQNRGLVWNASASVHERWVYATFNTDFRTANSFLLDRFTGEVRLVDLRKGGEERLGISANQWMGNRLMMSIASEDVAEFLTELDDDQWRFRDGTTLEEIESSEHRVVMWVTFKEISSE